MSYKEFFSWCNDRACDGMWDMKTAINCLDIIEEIEKIEVKFLGIKLKRKTERLKEEAWQSIINNTFNDLL